MSKKTVVLDAGHGGKDPGALGNGMREKDITLSVTLKVGKILKSNGVNVIYTRTNDKTLSLQERVNIANRNKADIFVSIHTNAFNDSSAKGLETYSFPNSVEGKKLAQRIQRQIINKRLYTSIRGIKTARFFVLRKTKMTSALTEMAFITNPEDAKLLRNKRNEFAEAIAIGILNYLGITYKVKKQENKKPSSGGLYKVQVGAFSNKKNAENLSNELKKKGYSTVIKKD